MLVTPSISDPPPRRSAQQRQLARAAELVAGHFAVTASALRRPGRGPGPANRARLVAMYLAHVSCGLPQAEVAGFFRRDRRDVGYACRTVEGLRDDPAFEAALAAFESALGAAGPPVSAALDRRVDAALAALRHGGALESLPDGKAVVRQNGRALLRVAAEAARALASSGLTDADGRITPEGEARLRRASAGEAGFLAQHLELGRVRDPEGCARLVVDLGESPLGWLARRKDKDGAPLLDAAQVAAGERLRADADRARLPPRVTTSWDAVPAPAARGDGMAAFADGALAARDRVNRALAAVGPELGGVLLDVCCFLKGLETLERERAWPPRAGRIVLGLALTRLAAHYGLASAARGPERGRLAGWRAPGARPRVGGGAA